MASHAFGVAHALLHAVMKNGKAKAWPESSCLLVKMIEMDEAYHSATRPTIGGSDPQRSQSYCMGSRSSGASSTLPPPPAEVATSLSGDEL